MSPDQAVPAEEPTRGVVLAIGSVALLAGLFASGALAVQAMGLIESMPGCGAGGACDELSKGPWGRLPLLGIPVSFLGCGWFIAMLLNWFLGRQGRAVRWLVRVAALYSIGSIILMIILGSFCPWCAVAQGANIGFWITHERRTRGSENIGGLRLAGVCGVLALVVAGLVAVRGVVAEEREARESTLLAENLEEIATTAPDPMTLRLLEGRHRIGPEDAAVELVMFTDYQCPDCRRLEGQASELLASNPDLSLVVKHFPFCTACNDHTTRTVHPNACWAARAAETAAILGGPSGFERMHAWLFENKGSFTDASFPDDLRSLGFDPAAFIGIMTSEETLGRVRSDTDDASRLGVYFTPMIFVNGHEYTWYYGGSGSLAAAVAAGRGRPARIPPTIREKLVEDWAVQPQRTLVGDDGRQPLGSGPIEVVVFGDYRSEPTRMLDEAVRGLVATNDELSYRFRHDPIDPECSERAERFTTTNPGACLDARIVEAVEISAGPEARWALHERLMVSAATDDRVGLLGELGLDAGAIMELAGTDPVIRKRLQEDIAEKGRVWRMHAPIVLIDGRFVPRWQHDLHPAREVLGMIIDSR